MIPRVLLEHPASKRARLRWRQRWVSSRPNPSNPEVLAGFRFFAVLGTYLEEDIVEACVRNAQTQGCEQVFVVDNGSNDETVERAVAVGATVAATFQTCGHDERARNALMNSVMERVSVEAGDDHIWWLWLDADEFPHGPRGFTIREHLSRLDRRFRVVGARYFNHYPTHEPAYVRGTHPLDLMPACEEVSKPTCPAGHRKHPLVRVDRTGPAIRTAKGFHRATSTVRLAEPDDPIFVHHFPYREQKTTRARLESLSVRRDVGAVAGARGSPITIHPAAAARLVELDAVYEQRWSDVQELRHDPHTGQVQRSSPHPRAWTELVAAPDAEVARWQSPAIGI